MKAEAPRQNATEHVDDLHLQIRELTNTKSGSAWSAERATVSGMIEKLKTELEQLRSEMPTQNSKLAPKQKPSRQQTIP